MFSGRRSFFKKMGLFLTGSIFGKGAIAAAEVRASEPLQLAAAPPAPAHSDAKATPAVAFDDAPIRRDFDLVVVGGGISGTACAISAARHGLKVALVHNRSMLGGNSSSEVKLYPENNAGHQTWIKEGGLNEEFHTEERVRNHREYAEGTMNCQWDLVLYEWAIRERNLTLMLNTHMHRANMQDAGRIESVFCYQLGTEKTFELHAPQFVDCSGDGYLAYRAKADFRWGREGRDEYNEPEAPEQANNEVMGNTLMFTAFDAGRPVPFKRPDWAAEFATADDLKARPTKYIQGGYWWIEVGAPYHPIADNNEIAHEALRQMLGVWDYIKNKAEHGAENYGMEFAGFWPYKRECRRVLGDFVLTQQHIQDPQPLPDDVAHGAWGIDIHVQGGILNRKEIPYEHPSSVKNWDRLRTLPYGIPLRALYSRNVENLWMAGRPISCSYVAFASTRVLSTGCMVGQAVGIAAAVAKQQGITPRAVAKDHAKLVQQQVLRDDGHIPGVVNEDPNDLARRATVTASSHAAMQFPEPNEAHSLKLPHAQIFSVSTDRLESVELLMHSHHASAVPLQLGLRSAAHVWDFRATEDIATATASVEPGISWVKFTFNAKVTPGRLYYIHTSADEKLDWKMFTNVDGQPSQIPPGITLADKPNMHWRRQSGNRCLAMKVTPDQRPFGPQNVVTGTNRPDQWTNIWISDPAEKLPAWIELRWPEVQAFDTVQLTFDTDQNRRMILPLFRYPDCVKDYRLEAWDGAAWRTIAEVQYNYVRRRVHRFDPVKTDRLRVTVLATNGGPTARIYEVRVYNESV